MVRRIQSTLSLGAVAALLILGGCSRPGQESPDGTPGGAAPAQQSIQIKGSDTMVNLGQAWAEAFGKKTGTQVAVTGGGSGTGIAALLNGTCDIAECSRKMKPKEFDQAREKGIEPVEFIVANDGLAVVVHPDNPVDKLTIDQLSDIFTGRVTNWKDLGGEDSDIVVLSREVNSGTHVYFKEHVVRKGDKESTAEYVESALLQPSSQAIADEVAQNVKAIGYYGMGYISEKQKPVAVATADGEPYVAPEMDNVVDGSYPLSRPLMFYTNGEPTGIVKEYLDFVLGEEGQQIVVEQDFVPLLKEESGDEDEGDEAAVDEASSDE